MKKNTVIIIGAGIGGITAAYRLQKHGFDVRVYEKSNYIGGRMKSVNVEGFNIDVGAGILPGAYRETKTLIREAGLTHLIEDVKGNCVFLRDDKQYPVDMGNMVGGLLSSKLISFISKLKLIKLLIDLAWHYRQLTFDNAGMAASSDKQTVAAYCDKYFPQEVKDYFIGTFVRTMYLHKPEEASITELLWCMKNLTGQPFSLKGGMDSLPKTLAKNLNIQLNTTVSDINIADNKVEVSINDGSTKRIESADYCYIATDAPTLDDLYGHALSHQQRNYLQQLRYCPDIVVTFCLSIKPAIDAILIQVPESVDNELAAIVIDHNKGSGRAPLGKGMITCHFVADWGRRMMAETDETIIHAATAAVAKIIPEVATHQEIVNIERWTTAATNTEVGTFKALANFMDDIDPQSPVLYGGDYMALSSVNVSIATANRDAASIIKRASK